MKKLLLPLLLCLLLAIAIGAEETFVNPVVNGADPFVFKDTDGTYYLYVTSGGSYGYRVHTSQNLVEWEAKGYCLRRADVYTDDTVVNENGNKIYNFWAPEVIKEGDTYYMVYTAQEHIGIATSDSPLGPFTNKADSYLLPEFRNIDGHFFRDDDGKVYLYFVSAGAVTYNGCTVTGGNNIWGGEFDLATQTFKTAPTLLINYDKKYEYMFTSGKTVRDSVAEGPELLKHGGKYYLTYSASGYTDPAYAVHYATADSPLGPYTKYTHNPILRSDDDDCNDYQNPHLYGTAHHCFTTSPDGKELIIVYHAHRTGDHTVDNGVEERRICIDLAWFDANGVLHAGRKQSGVPTATAQVLPSGGKLTRETHYDGVFAPLPSLPTVYVAYKDGLDTNDGSRSAPFKTLAAAYAALPNGGTITLLQSYSAGTYFDAPAVNGPICIKGEFSVPFTFKFLSVNSDTYFDDIVFWPNTANNVSVIEGNFCNVTMGDGVSCIAQPTLPTFPVLVGGVWRYSGNDSSATYDNFRYATDAATASEKPYTLRVYSGTWSIASAGNVRDTTMLKADYTPKAVLVLTGDAIVRPKTPDAPKVRFNGFGAMITVSPVDFAETYLVYKNGEKLGYTDGTTYLDKTYVPGTKAKYSVAPYANGACIGNTSSSTTLTSFGDRDANGEINITDVLLLLEDLLHGNEEISLLDVIRLLVYAAQ